MSLAEFTVRDATEADLPAIVEIYNTTIAGRMVTADIAPVSVESRVAWFRNHDRKRRPLWVVIEDDQICAWLSFNDFYGRPAYNPTAEISIYVAESHRRRGVGRGLLEKAIADAPGFSIRTLLGFIWAHNAPSLQLFEAYGFERWGHLPRVAELDQVERDLIIVGRRVS
jgi:L-amino acid N-acyltransferase YncA